MTDESTTNNINNVGLCDHELFIFYFSTYFLCKTRYITVR